MNIMNFKGLADWVEIFKGGEQTDSKGRAHNFTEADLDQIIANHDPEHPAPHVITHKELYSPFAYGQAHELKREGLTVFAKSKSINPTFEKLVKDGALYERSIRIEKTPKGLKLGHIAWLGAEPPAVEGLAPVQFSKDDPESFDFSSPPNWLLPDALSRFMRGIREWIITKFGLETADQVVPNYQIDSIGDMATRLRDESNFSQSDNNGGSTVQFTQADIDRAKKEAEDKAQADFEKREKDLKDQQEADRLQFEKERAEFRRSEFRTFVDEQIDAGKLLPAQAEGAVEFMAQLAGSDAAEFEFSRGEEGKKQTVKAKPADWFKDFVKSLPKQIHVGRPRNEEAEVDGADAQAITKAATEYQAEQRSKGIEISGAAAVAHVTKGVN